MTEPVSTGAAPDLVGPYLARVLSDERWVSPEVSLVAGGKSNLTYIVTSPAGRVVLRRPPLAAVLPTAHDMEREHRVLAALQATPVPVPQVLDLCTDTAVLGAPFYVMAYVDGLVLREDIPAGYADGPAEREKIADSVVDVLLAIHAVPTGGALEGFGRPDGYLARQIRRWTGQWEQSREVDLPALDALAKDLSAGMPEQRETTLVHGDYRLDNMLVDKETPGKVLAVLDWELSTLGDPLADVGLLGVYWGGSEGVDEPLLVKRVTSQAGFPLRSQVLTRYAERSGRDAEAMPWYVAFGYFKLAVIAAGIAARARAGGMLGEGFDTVAATVPVIVDQGRRILSDGTLD